MRVKLRPELICLLLLILLIFLPFALLILTNRFFPDTGMVYNDMTSFYYSLKDWYKNQLLAGQFPFWTNLVGNGYPVFAEGEIGALYPLNILFYFLLPTLLAFNLNLFLHFLLAAVFTYLLSRIAFKLSPIASIMAALSYSLSGFFFSRISYVHMIFVVAYFPLNLLLIERIMTSGKLKFSLLLALVFSLQIFIGYIEMFFYCLVLSFGYLGLLLLTQKYNRKKAIFLTGMAVILAIFICTIQLLPNWEVVQNSHRASGLAFEAATASQWPLSALSLFVNPRAMDKYSTEDFSVPTVYGYIGLIPLVLALLVLTQMTKKRPVFILVILMIFAFLWAQGRLSQIFAIVWETLPGVKFFRAPVKLLFAIELFLAVLAGIGFDWLKEKLSITREKSGNFVILVSILILIVIYGDLLYFNRGLQPSVPGQNWLKEPKVISFLRNNLDTINYQIYSHGTNNMDFQTTKNLSLQQDFQNILPPNLNLLYGIPANREAFALFLHRQQELNNANTTMDVSKGLLSIPPKLKQAIAVQGVKYLLSDVPFADPDLKQVLVLPFSQTVDHRAPLKTGETAKIKVSATHVYANQKVYPRINFVSNVKDMTGKSEEEILNTVLDANFNPTKEVILENMEHGTWNMEQNKQNLKQDATFTIKKYQENETEIQVKTNTSGFLVLARTYYPGWQAEVDGQATKIYRANYAFQAVAVPQGEHLVKFNFIPTSWDITSKVTIVSLVITLLALAFLAIKDK